MHDINFFKSHVLYIENLTQMFDALERQLGMYDVRIAEMDLRFQVCSVFQ